MDGGEQTGQLNGEDDEEDHGEYGALSAVVAVPEMYQALGLQFGNRHDAHDQEGNQTGDGRPLDPVHFLVVRALAPFHPPGVSAESRGPQHRNEDRYHGAMPTRGS
ncbi:hypothetical protein [Actinomadura opuntiae]|uniref:hypothetical protein n=1 Tax=Actinomadura sp. OS1-43 TaxID=604315 RepID=UPI00255AE076|nr:hypothetical protein [Actinomadura sp. OS1-43]MDL4821502.1 hypothetical protein [Actinomadura sp. OS1-43]